MWLKKEGYVEKVRDWWALYNFTGSPSFILAKKLNALKFNLKHWNLEVFGNIDNNKKWLLEQLHFLEDKELIGNISFRGKDEEKRGDCSN